MYFQKILTTLVFATLVPLSLAPVSANERLALVIGNSSYRNVPALPNTTRDSSDVATALARLGYAVTAIQNADYDTMRRAFLDFGRQARNSEIAIVYFAGHGMEVGGENWLIPVDAEMRADIDAENEAITLKSLLVTVSSAAKLGLVILDACRNNPFTSKMQRTVRTRSVERGLARIEPGGSVLVAYAARDGTTAADGTGRNSPFTAALLRYIETPGLEVSFLFRNVRDDVLTATGRLQEPYVYGSLSRQAIYLNAATVVQQAIAPAPPTPASLSPATTKPESIVVAPNEMLPGDIPLDPDVLQMIETHPFFANSPAMRLSAYNVGWTSSSAGSGSASTSTSNDSAKVRWLRKNIIFTEMNQQMTSKVSGSTTTSTQRTRSLSAGNGLIGLGYVGSGTSNIPQVGNTTTTSSSKIIRIENLSGRVFDFQLGARLTYRTKSQTAYQSKHGNGGDEQVDDYSCEYTKQFDARVFHRDLVGRAYLLDCNMRTSYKKNVAANSTTTSKSIYFEILGTWLTVDPVTPKERVVANNTVSSGRNFTATWSADYVLRSFQLAH